MQIDQRNWK